MTHDEVKTRFEFPRPQRRVALASVALGALALAMGFALDPRRAWANFLIDGYYFVGLAACGTFFVALQCLCGARWAEGIRRVPEAVMAYLPVGALLMLPIFFGLPALYEWATPEAAHDAALAARAPYVSVSGYMARLVIFLGLWTVLSAALRRESLGEDADGCPKRRRRNVIWSALFVIVFAYTFSLGSIDWIMSLEPHWYSTMFGVYAFSGLFVNGLAVIALMTVLLRERGYLVGVNENHFHDLGKLIFAFSMFWAYIWFCQFMLIWYGNIPEETAYFHRRLHGDWDWLFFTNFFVNFVVPFFILLPRASKRSPAVLKRVSILLLIGHWLDLFLLAAPGLGSAVSSIGPLEVAMALGYAGLFALVAGRALAAAPLMPEKSPYLAESLHYHQ